MNERKFKVVNCTNNIPRADWGKVINDNEQYTCIDTYKLRPSDTFPLPQQGDKVEVSDDNDTWFGGNGEYAIFKFYDEDRKVFVVYDVDTYPEFKYIRPIPIPSNTHCDQFCEKFYNKFKMQIFSPELEQQIDDTLKLGEELKRSIKDIHLTGKFTYKKSADCPNCEFLDKLFSDIQHRSYREKYLYHEVFVYLHGGDELCNWNELCNWKEE